MHGEALRAFLGHHAQRGGKAECLAALVAEFRLALLSEGLGLDLFLKKFPSAFAVFILPIHDKFQMRLVGVFVGVDSISLLAHGIGVFECG